MGRHAERAGGGTALVTGASGGIGTAVATTLAARGVDLTLTGRNIDRLAAVARDCRGRGVEVAVIAADLRVARERDRLRDRVQSASDPLDLLVNCAGLPRRVRAERLDEEDVRAAIEVNYVAPAVLTLACLPTMLERGRGRIVNVGSLAGRVPPPREAAYAASKHALAAFTDCLAADLVGTGVSIHLVTPAVVNTGLWRRGGQEPAAVQGHRGVPPQLVADAVVRLIETGRYESYVPRRHRLTFAARALLGRWFQDAARSYDRRGRRRP